MSQDLYHRIQDQLSQAIQEQAALVQEESIQASPEYLVAEAAQLDFIRRMREIEAMPCKPLTAEELEEIRQGILNIAFCDECSQPAQDGKKCDNCGDTLCDDCCYYNKDDYYEDNDVVFCFECWTERQSEEDEI